MNERTPEQLDKILALADSEHDGEALVAVRKARQILLRDGLSFGDLARAVSVQTFGRTGGFFASLSDRREQFEARIHHLSQQIEDLRSQLQTQDLQVDFWRRRAMELEQSSVQALGEAEKWKKLASETADRLWEMGRAMGGDEFVSDSPASESEAVAVKK